MQINNQKEANFLRLLLLVEQRWRCPITGYRLNMMNSVLDHDHFTGEVRGVLFNGANRVLQDQQWQRYGIRREDHPAMLRAMAGYLERKNLEAVHHSCKAKPGILTKTSYNRLEAAIKGKGKLPAWWGYKRRQKLNKRLQVLFEKYNIDPEFYVVR